MPGVLKTRRLGYDGRGQFYLRKPQRRRQPPGQTLGSVPLIYEGFVELQPRGFDHRRAQHARRNALLSARRPTRTAAGILRYSIAPYRNASLQKQAETYLKRLLQALRLRRRADDRVLRRARPADRQRDGAARPQFRALDHRGRADQPVRESRARDSRAAARQHPADRPFGHAELHRHASRRSGTFCACRAYTFTVTAKSRGRTASSGIARSMRPRPPPATGPCSSCLRLKVD